ncbi:MAG: sodium:proton antiporter [Phormidesmis priestleyi]|uniref:Sodium:proton antiporter n=1 Tax=Phormidesmis priestleyi TaxID=268141 RepID=A0A2W4WP10_9CYAN|nr:MAG: sodium:proton antiporter [Phormidesmis priestleyi]
MSFKNHSSNNNLDLISVLLISFGLLISSALTGTFIAYPLLAALMLLSLALIRRGFSARSLFHMAVTGARQSLPVVKILLLIGAITAVWMAAGTVPALVYYGTGLISARFFILWAFLLTSGVSVLLGTSFGAAGTIGIALMVMARSGGVDVNPVAGAIIAGAFVGDRCSPMSSSAHLVASITHTSIYSNLRNMVISSLWPMAIALLFYTGLSLLHPLAIADHVLTAELAQVFNLSPVVLLPALAILLLALLRVDVKLAMLVSIGLGVALAHGLQHYTWLSIIRFTLVGYHLDQVTPLQSILLGGGLLPMAKATLIVLLSTAFAGIFAGSRILSFVDTWLSRDRTQPQTACVTVLIAIVSNLFGCTQTIAILLTGQLMQPHYASNEQLALALEDTAVVIAPLVPWNIAGLIPATVLAVSPGFIPYTAYLLLLPLFFACRSYLQPDQSLARET